MKKFYKILDEVPQPLVDAYETGRYVFDPALLPVQAHTHWTKVEWINFVRFNPDLEKLREAADPA
jgi:hypothetical protein